MKKKYQEEMNQVHAPKELIDRTRMSMGIEEKKIRRGDFRWIRFTGIMATAAAVILVCLAVSAFFRGTEVPQEQGTQLYLGEINSRAPEKINADEKDSTEKKAELEIFSVMQIPDEFKGDLAENTEIEGFPLTFIKDGQTGFYLAILKQQKKLFMVKSEIEDEDYFLEAVRSFLLDTWQIRE